MIIKKIFILLLLCIFLTGCVAAPFLPEYKGPEHEGRLVIIHRSVGYCIMVDTQTRVCYFQYDNGLSVMLDTDGSPILYDGVLPR